MAKNSTVNQLFKIIDAVRGSIYWKDTEGRYLGCNKYMLDMAGLSKLSDIIGKRDTELPWKHIANELSQTDYKVIQDKLTLEIEESPTLFNQKQKTFLTTKTPLFDESHNLIGIIGISMDITARKKTEQELKTAKELAETANQAKTEFLRNMRHDFRTPFSGILGLADFMESQETDPEKKENLGYIAESAKALLDHLNEIMEFIEAENGQLPILDKVFDIQQLLTDIHRITIPTAKNKGLTFSIDRDKSLPQFLIGDSVRTQRILMNLISNAIKFTQEGYVNISVQHSLLSGNKIALTFTIKDSGMGIPEDKQNLIFERFNRVTSSYSGIYPGKGLGLRIVKQFLDEMDGECELISTSGKGTIFKVMIPYKLPLSKREENRQSNN